MAVPTEIRTNYAKLPLAFEANEGQADARVKFVSRAAGHALLLTSNGELLLHRTTPAQPDVRMKLLGANPAPQATGLEKQPGVANYLIGNDPRRWRTDIPTFARVKYADIYKGIDLLYYGNLGAPTALAATSRGRRAGPPALPGLENDFIVSPGADPKAIRIAFEGAGGISIDRDRSGDLILRANGADLRLRKPTAYQESPGGRRQVAAGYAIDRRGRIAFRLGRYDRTQPLVIDPVLTYSTFLGGTLYDFGEGIAIDPAGNAYVAGYTSSPDFPVTSGAFDRTCGTNGLCNFIALDAFVTKLNSAGTAIVYSTFLGGSGNDWAYGIAVDSFGNAYVTGYTDSSDFPTTPNAFQRANGGGKDIFAAKLNGGGSALLYSTYLGGSGDDVSFAGAAVDPAGNLYVTGYTLSPNFPTTPNAFDRSCGTDGACNGGLRDAFVAKINPTASGAASLVYSTFLGGSNEDEGRGVAADSAGNVYVAGYTVSTDFPTTAGAFDRGCGIDSLCNGGFRDAFVTKLNTAAAGASSLVYSTYLGGSGTDVARAIAIDSAGNAWVTGSTSSADFPIASLLPSPPAQPAFGGGPEDGFIAKLSPQGSALLYSTFLGGSGDDVSESIALDASGNVYVAGYTNSTNFPAKAALQATEAGDDDAFITKLSASGALIYSTYLGGTGKDRALDLAVDAPGSVYVVGYTESGGAFPTTPGSAQSASGGLGDAFIAKITDTSGIVPPSINPGGVVNASFNNQPPSAGSIATLFGTGLSATVAWASTLPLPRALEGVSVLVNGTAAPLFYVSPTQINFQVPWEAAALSQVSVTVSINGVLSAAQSLTLPGFSPGIFAVNQAGAGQGAILLSATSEVAAPAGSIPGTTARPARVGEFISIFCTGLGPVTNRPATGAPALNSPLSVTSSTVQASIGGVPAVAGFAGLAPNFVGLYQVNVPVPVGAPSGNAVPVSIAVGGVTSNQVTIAIQ